MLEPALPSSAVLFAPKNGACHATSARHCSTPAGAKARSTLRLHTGLARRTMLFVTLAAFYAPRVAALPILPARPASRDGSAGAQKAGPSGVQLAPQSPGYHIDHSTRSDRAGQFRRR